MAGHRGSGTGDAVEEASACEQSVEASRQGLSDLVLLRRKQTGQTADIQIPAAELLADHAHGDRRQHGEERIARALAYARKLGHGAGERSLILSAKHRLEQRRSLIEKR